MDLAIDIQGFRDVNGKFIPKEVAVVAINAAITGHWILSPPYPFDDLPEKPRRENNWLSRNYHGIEWFDGETDLNCFTLHLREITRQVRYIYCRGVEKARYLSQLLSRNIYNLEEISPPFKSLPETREYRQHCSHHGFRVSTTDKIVCALRNAFKLKRWLVLRDNSECSNSSSGSNNSIDSSYDTNLSYVNLVTSDDEGEKKTDSDIAIKINHWQKNNETEEKEEGEVAKAYYSIAGVRKEYIFNNSPILPSKNTNSTTPKKVNSEIIQIIPLVRSPHRCVKKNELARNLTSVASSQCQICGSLSCRQTAEGVDEVDCHRR